MSMTYRCSRWKSNLVVRFNDDTGISVHFFPTKHITQTFMLPSCWRFYKHVFLQQKLKFDQDSTKNMIVLVLTTWMDRRSMHWIFYCTTILGVCEHKEPMNMHEYATTSNSTIVLFWWSFHSVYLIFPGMFQYTFFVPKVSILESPLPSWITYPKRSYHQNDTTCRWVSLGSVALMLLWRAWQIIITWEICLQLSIEWYLWCRWEGRPPPK